MILKRLNKPIYLQALVKIAIFVLSIILIVFFYQDSESFRFNRTAVLAGDYWLLLTGHFAHTNLSHLWLNLFAWFFIWLYGWPVCNGLVWLLFFTVSALGTSLGLLLVLEVDWYMGLSAILHGLLIAIVLLRIAHYKRDYGAWLLVFAISLKLVYEHTSPTGLGTSELIGAPVLIEAHLAGVVSGVVAWLLNLLIEALVLRYKKAPAV